METVEVVVGWGSERVRESYRQQKIDLINQTVLNTSKKPIIVAICPETVNG